MSHAGLNTHEGSTTSLASTTNSSSSGSGEGSAGGDSDDRVALAQALLQRCLQKDTLLCELYMQLIKQTTDHPEPSSRVSARHWALLCAAVGAALPPAKPLRRLLLAHLRYRGTALHAGEEGKFARRAEQVRRLYSVPRLIHKHLYKCIITSDQYRTQIKKESESMAYTNDNPKTKDLLKTTHKDGSPHLIPRKDSVESKFEVALSIAQVGRRNSAPSREELLCAAARRPMHVRVLLLDGKQHGLVFGPAATADHLVAMLREKIGLSDSAPVNTPNLFL
ncbi:hypothetical protein RR46_13429 [Papilio xuthus]|uniref:Uncharacterized protein n=1 Tax=Papilio xuthus TaxID=66420 RepID=A0A194PGP6_PAPXU|nr:hypothetical protein RR46_13429 [Papilio xuthus]